MDDDPCGRALADMVKLDRERREVNAAMKAAQAEHSHDILQARLRYEARKKSCDATLQDINKKHKVNALPTTKDRHLMELDCYAGARTQKPGLATPLHIRD